MENTVAQKLEALVKLQSIDTQLDEIKKIRGALPEEVNDLEDDIAGFETRIQKYNDEIQAQETRIDELKVAKKDAENLIVKYNDQQMNVRNNREYDAITKEIELQNLEIQVCEKRTKEANATIERINSQIEETNQLLNDKKEDLETKQNELGVIISESEDDENKLLKSRDKAYKIVDERLRTAYDRIRKNARNGLAVVNVERNACGGCFNMVPPQRQSDIREKKKIIVCEHCGRILADVEIELVPEEKPKRTKRTTTKKKSS
ncbi:zinc ribbon domain-containing protein [Aureibacter tunicatorum]|uniref:C4-type zinc ribbon domain-containing protein n=1 Tax=Aureibacter tunicatorum TaxID=866807 RepID=A0AAE3XPR9_9BACT|nr:C4-type zinc ribbon domain-containing protein [Aureibacter tunicatorum]MDR6239074.1 hypothetical protein [Aureibacter tunicatorum]BDD05000.1 hypothetical protein AUTU_24830 [Aureibacter tunicatorum]